MNTTTSTRFVTTTLAAIVLLFSLWQITSAIVQLQTVSRNISELQTQPNSVIKVNPEQWLIIAGSHGAGGASLQARLRATARSADVSLTRIEIKPQNTNAIDEVRATAQASGNIKAIADFIYQLENEAPALVIERARITKGNANQLDLDLLLLARVSKRDTQ
jgi:sarcosine oxidase gamma subunit